MKLTDVYNNWLPVKRRQVKESTISAYQLLYIKVIEPKLGNEDVETLNKKTIIPFIYGLLDSGRSRKYCTDILIVLKMIIRFASEELEIAAPDTGWRITLPTHNKLPKPKVERYTPDEYKKIVDYVGDHPSPRNLGILLTLCTGMRIGELCALQWKDIDFYDKTIHVNKTIERIYIADNIGTEKKRTKMVIGPPKTTSSDRHIPILKDILPVLKRFAAVCNPDYYVCTCSEKYADPRNMRNYYRYFILDKVKLDHCIKFHGLRHTFASTLIENKVDVKTASAILGHSDVSTTLNVYVHPSDEAKKNAINAGLRSFFR
ncbi:Tyrosine recombinase XerC [Bacteroides pyogenes]|uniref:tyrosine-type recombinase/integrase n=1 Tax=Bacteroides pyogenes TaxID=310300 RepID=UPI001BA9680E|nr:site-specific integrase [Bacteroides pyogenes]MBR8719956.1 Tyrosine recombinase XerC [Bacteroides pyogenes]MBR8786843.1 Tyrosine recombinase XerC [Bacteroides pyogenes]MBR8792328.1 Tyrosine recombinase XerC [Bacteroides pyogenes]